MFTEFLRVEIGSYNETCVTLHDGNEVASIKVEEATAAQEEEDPLLIKLPVIKAELEVSCRRFGYPSVCVHETIILCWRMDMSQF
jgi:hypothetical protein